MLRSLRIALRTLLRRPGFTVVAVGTLAVGIGATTALFAVVHSVLLDPLPYPDADALVRVHHPVPLENEEWRWSLSEAGFFALRESNGTLEDLAVYSRSTTILGSEGVAERVGAALVSANLFDVLGARPALGRLLRWEDNDPAAPSVAVLSHQFWTRALGADPSVVGSEILLQGFPRQVVGVVEPGFGLPDGETDLWLPVEISPENQPVNWHRFASVGRLRPGVDGAQAESDLKRVVATFAERLPSAYAGGFIERTGFTVEVVPLHEHVVGDVSTALWVLLGAVAIVLLIGCANVANLLLVRMEGGRRERAVRTALGATRLDLAAGSVTECLLLTSAAGVLALLLAMWGLELLLAFSPDLPRLENVGISSATVLFTIVVAVFTGAVFGLLPALTGRPRLEWLREGAGLTTSRGRNLVRGGLVVGEMALALVLLMAAGLMIRTFENLRDVEPGLDPAGVLTVQVSLPVAEYRDYEPIAGFYRDLLDRVQGLAGVSTAGATTHLPLASGGGCAIMFTDDPAAVERMRSCFILPVLATPGYFEAMGIDVEGRTPGWAEMENGRAGVVITGAVAEQVWPGEDPLGRGIRGNGNEPPFYTVVGVSDHLRAERLDGPSAPQVYFPMLPMPGTSLWSPPRSMTLAVRTATDDPTVLAGPVRQAIRDLAPGAAIGEIRPMTAVIADSMGSTSFAMLLLGIAATVALALGVIGLYGVISYVVEHRRTEIGIRMALGAPAALVKRRVVAEAARLAGIGVLVGGVASLIVSRALASQLYGVSANDPLTLAAVALLLLGVAVAAAYEPASRAARVEPMQVLRGE
ncbi:MAG TPA: ABC transporter permease [Longimicrobiales bacterium]|nr:ABC transporter permease [Longimicrobiales bacterium]